MNFENFKMKKNNDPQLLEPIFRSMIEKIIDEKFQTFYKKIQDKKNESRSEDDMPMTIKTLATKIERSVSHIYHLVSEKKIPYHKTGRLYFFPSEIRDWIKNKRT